MSCGKATGPFYKCPACLPPNGLLCEDCYKKGKHSKHDGCEEAPGASGSCDCGSHYYMNRENCCEDHPVPNGGSCGNRRGQMWRCSCMKQSGSLLCDHCIEEGKHSGHDKEKTNSSGTCDCGSDSYIPEENFCDAHPGYAMLTGRCYYKSGFASKKGRGIVGKFSTTKRWLQVSHTSMTYYTEKKGGYNWPDPGSAKPDPSSGLSMPSLSMPSLSMPDVSMPSMSMPSMSAPSMSMPSLGKPSLSMPKKHTRSKDKLGHFHLSGTNVKRSGKQITIANVRLTRYFDDEPKEEVKDGQKFVFKAEDDEQAESWYETLLYGGCDKA